MGDLFTNLTSEYRIQKMVVNMPIPYIEHLKKRSKSMMLHRAEIIRHCLRPDIVDCILGFSNDKEEKKLDDLTPSHKGGFHIQPKFKYWHTW